MNYTNPYGGGTIPRNYNRLCDGCGGVIRGHRGVETQARCEPCKREDRLVERVAQRVVELLRKAEEA